jgi:exopolyphosphatase/guanosine-5'-triphosphate,3'-diphosphate pyrophosphatase
VGAVRLTESFLPSDPPRPDEIVALQRHLDAAFQDAPESVRAGALVGVAGTVANLANIAIYRNLEPRDVHGFALSADMLADEIAEFRRKTTAERAAIPGMEPKRAGVILAGALIIERVMRHFGHEVILTSVRGLRFGVFYDRFLAGADGWECVAD